MTENILSTNEQRLAFILEHLKVENQDIAKEFKISKGQASKICHELKPMHLHAFSSAYNIPMEVFTDRKINSPKKILEELKPQKKLRVFEEEEELSRIIGTWYAYVYAGNTFSPIHCIETTIHPDYSISDENNNYGQLLIGELQSVLIKKTVNSKNYITIIFENSDVGYELFHFSMISKRNQVKREMCNFGFFSKKKITFELAKTILG